MSTDDRPRRQGGFYDSDRVRAATILGACIVLAALIWTFGRWGAPGRYQMGSTPGHAYVLDTATGEVWEQFATPNSEADSGFRKRK
jgi:hypothetical protein